MNRKRNASPPKSVHPTQSVHPIHPPNPTHPTPIPNPLHAAHPAYLGLGVAHSDHSPSLYQRRYFSDRPWGYPRRGLPRKPSPRRWRTPYPGQPGPRPYPSGPGLFGAYPPLPNPPPPPPPPSYPNPIPPRGWTNSGWPSPLQAGPRGPQATGPQATGYCHANGPLPPMDPRLPRPPGTSYWDSGRTNHGDPCAPGTSKAPSTPVTSTWAVRDAAGPTSPPIPTPTPPSSLAAEPCHSVRGKSPLPPPAPQRGQPSVSREKTPSPPEGFPTLCQIQALLLQESKPHFQLKQEHPGANPDEARSKETEPPAEAKTLPEIKCTSEKTPSKMEATDLLDWEEIYPSHLRTCASGSHPMDVAGPSHVDPSSPCDPLPVEGTPGASGVASGAACNPPSTSTTSTSSGSTPATSGNPHQYIMPQALHSCLPECNRVLPLRSPCSYTCSSSLLLQGAHPTPWPSVKHRALKIASSWSSSWPGCLLRCGDASQPLLFSDLSTSDLVSRDLLSRDLQPSDVHQDLYKMYHTVPYVHQQPVPYQPVPYVHQPSASIFDSHVMHHLDHVHDVAPPPCIPHMLKHIECIPLSLHEPTADEMHDVCTYLCTEAENRIGENVKMLDTNVDEKPKMNSSTIDIDTLAQIDNKYVNSTHTPPLSSLLFSNKKSYLSSIYNFLNTSFEFSPSQTYGIPFAILNELKEKHMHTFIKPPSLYEFLHAPKLPRNALHKKTSIFDHLYLKTKPKTTTYIYRVSTRRNPAPPSTSTHEEHDMETTLSDASPDDHGHNAHVTPTPSLHPVDDLITSPPIHQHPLSTSIEIIPSSTSPILQENTTRLPTSQHPTPLRHYSLTKLVHKPQYFKGTGKNFKQMYTHEWIDQMKCWLDSIDAPDDQRATIALTYLQPPAFNVLTAEKRILQNNHQWTNTFQQFCDILLKHFGDIDTDFTFRTKLSQLYCNSATDLGRYTRAFQNLASRIIREPLLEEAKVTMYLNGIVNPFLYRELLIEPLTGSRWTNFSSLCNYVLTKYTTIMPIHQRINNFPRNSSRPNDPRRPPFNSFPRRSFTHRGNSNNFNSHPNNGNNRFNRPRTFRRNFNQDRRVPPRRFSSNSHRQQESNPNHHSNDNNNQQHRRPGNFSAIRTRQPPYPRVRPPQFKSFRSTPPRVSNISRANRTPIGKPR